MKLTATARRRITADWLAAFPGLGEYEPLHLLRRVGPLLEGIVLERSSGSRDYLPTFHVHSLLRTFPSVSLTLIHRLRAEPSGAADSISVQRHESRYMEAASRLARQSPLALSGDLRASEVLRAYQEFAARPENRWHANNLFEDMAAMCGWFGDNERSSAFIAEGFAKLGEWSPSALRQIGGREQWRRRLEDLVADRNGLHSIMEKEIRALHLESLPVAFMIFDWPSNPTRTPA